LSEYFFLSNVGNEIINSINLSKFTSNRRSQLNKEVNFKVGVYIQKNDSIKWQKLDEVEFNKVNNIVLSSSDYNLTLGQLAVIIPCNVDMDLKDIYDTLPDPISRKIDLSPVAERAAVYFKKGKAFSSYQGEFPYLMSRIKGSFLTFDPLMKSQNASIKTKMVLINIHSQKLNEKEFFTLNVANSLTKELLLSKDYVHNSACIIDIKSINNEELCFYSKNTLGIPIFISYDENGYLSVEHNHPPSEYFYNNSINGQKILKQNWFSQLQ
jgi:hypothetical protein